MMRVQGKTKQLSDGHPVMDQIQRVKLRYLKLNEAVQEKDKVSKEQARMRIDKEATERIVRNALGSQQLREDELKQKQRSQKASSGKANRNLLSSDSDD